MVLIKTGDYWAINLSDRHFAIALERSVGYFIII